MRDELKGSYESCEQIARTSGSNFYRSFSLLRPDKRRAVTALYAYARIIDDLGDAPSTSVERQNNFDTNLLHHWIEGLADDQPDVSSYALGELVSIRLGLRDSIQIFEIPLERLHEMVRGVALDQVDHVRIADQHSLDHYCYLVASSVGLACISIWRGEMEALREMAIDCGRAFQLTNILRDVAEDAKQDRVYLPTESLAKHHIEIDSWLRGSPNGDWKTMLGNEIDRAKLLYLSGWGMYGNLENDGQRMFSLMWHTYYRLLLRIESQLETVWTHRVRLGHAEKLQLYFQHALTPTYLRLNQNPISKAPHLNAF